MVPLGLGFESPFHIEKIKSQRRNGRSREDDPGEYDQRRRSRIQIRRFETARLVDVAEVYAPKQLRPPEGGRRSRRSVCSLSAFDRYNSIITPAV